MSIELMGLGFMPVLVYMIWKKYYLNQSELTLLISSVLMLVVLAFDSWVTYVGYLILTGWQMIILFSMAKLTYYFDRNKSTHTFSDLTVFIFKVEQEELMLILYAVILWVWIRVKALKSLNFILNGGTFLTLLKGWNCTLSEFWWINGVWMGFCFLSGFACNFLIKNEHDRNNLYKSYLYKYKILIDQICLTIVTVFSLVAYINANKLQTCLSYFSHGIVIRLVWFWSMPLSTIIFLFKKNGQFSVQSHSDETEQQNELEQSLNRRQIDRQHSQLSNKSNKQTKKELIH